MTPCTRLEPPFRIARPRDPLSIRVVSPSTISRVSDTWPPSGLEKRESLLERVRDVWTLRYIETNCTAAIYRTTFGLELRVEHGGELIESRLSRYGIEPLLLIADQIER